jgi:predicted dehydrogenase
MAPKMHRRDFLKKSLTATAALSFISAHGETQGANSDVRIAVIGFHGRGGAHIAAYNKMPGVRIVALCDVDSKVLRQGVEQFKKRGKPVEGYLDIRKLLENKDIDAISIATPNHWHALGTIWALQAGKDVYVEKPVSHNVWEGRQMVEATGKYKQIVQVGTQARTGMREAMQWLHDGNIGKVIRARAVLYKRRPSIGQTVGPQPIPPSVDYDLWTGPAPMGPLRRAKLHYDWHWVWPTGNGDLGNTGPHHMDLARWALGIQELSPQVLSLGGRVGYIDDGTTPNTQLVFHDYQPAPLIFEMRGLPSATGSEAMDLYRGTSIGNMIDCEHGSMVVPGYNQATFYDADGKEIKKFKGPEDEAHFVNFVQAVRSRKASDLHANILNGHLSSALCHTANISYRLGSSMSQEAMKDALAGDKISLDAYERMHGHLLANGLDLDRTKLTMGTTLKMNPSSERFLDNEDANKLLTREYRPPFVVPEKV